MIFEIEFKYNKNGKPGKKVFESYDRRKLQESRLVIGGKKTRELTFENLRSDFSGFSQHFFLIYKQDQMYITDNRFQIYLDEINVQLIFNIVNVRITVIGRFLFFFL